MQLTTKPVMNPNLAPIHHPIQPKTIMPTKIQSLFISYPTRIMANDNYTVCIKRETLSPHASGGEQTVSASTGPCVSRRKSGQRVRSSRCLFNTRPISCVSPMESLGQRITSSCPFWPLGRLTGDPSGLSHADAC